MNRFGPLWVVGAAIFGVISLGSTGSNTIAQEGVQATVEALQTEVADLKTMVALQNEVAGLRTQLTPAAVSEATPIADEETVLYEADWSEGRNGWRGNSSWDTVSGMLVGQGRSEGGSVLIFAPYEPGTLADYAVEAEIQVLRHHDAWCSGVGVLARYGDEGGLWGGFYACEFEQSDLNISAGTDIRQSISSIREAHNAEWHTYRLEVEGNTIRLYLDGELALVDRHA